MKHSLPLALAVLMFSSTSVMAADVSGDPGSTFNPAKTSGTSTNKAPIQTETQSEVDVKTEKNQVDQGSQSETKAEPTQSPEAQPSKSSSKSSNDELKTETQASDSSSTHIQKLFSTYQKDNAPQAEANAPISTSGQLPVQK
jgi:hypothetical protein